MYFPLLILMSGRKRSAHSRRGWIQGFPKKYTAAVSSSGVKRQSSPSKRRAGIYLQNSRMESVRLPSISDIWWM